jgi:hypothetical protein
LIITSYIDEKAIEASKQLEIKVLYKRYRELKIKQHKKASKANKSIFKSFTE